MGNWVLESNTIVSHVLCRDLIDKEWDRKLQKSMQENREYIDDEVHKCLPNTVFEGSLHFPEDGISTFHSPFHTKDCIRVYDAVDKVLYTGDNFGFEGGKAALWGNDILTFQRLETNKQYDFDICVSGHTEPQAKEIIVFLELALAEAQEKQIDG